jgi:hypothetical protein
MIERRVSVFLIFNLFAISITELKINTINDLIAESNIQKAN